MSKHLFTLVDLVNQAIGRGAWAIEIVTEGSFVTLQDDAPATFADFADLENDLSIELHRDGQRLSAELRAGEMSRASEHGSTGWTGTRVGLTTAIVNRGALRDVLSTICVFHPSLSIIFDGEDLSQPRGLAGAVAREVGGERLHPHPLRFAGNRDRIQVDVAVQWRTRSGVIRGFVNQRECSGHHVSGFERGLVRAVARPDINDPVLSELLLPGLVAVVAVEHPRRCSIAGDDIASVVAEITHLGLGVHRRVLDHILDLRSLN